MQLIYSQLNSLRSLSDIEATTFVRIENYLSNLKRFKSVSSSNTLTIAAS